MNDFFHWLILALAVDAIMVVWFKGYWLYYLENLSLISHLRAKAEAWDSSPRFIRRLRAKPFLFFGYMFSCRICLPLHLALWLFLIGEFVEFGYIGIYVLAAGGLASRIFNKLDT